MSLCFSGQDCLRQQAPPNGYIQGANATNYGDTIAFGCYLPYVIQGSATRTCQASGKWDGAPPVCTCKYDLCEFGMYRATNLY